MCSTVAKSELRTKMAQLRAMSGLRAQDFASISGRSFHTQKALESGRLALSQSLAVDIAMKTGVSLDWLLDDEVSGPPMGANGKELTQRDLQAHIGGTIAPSLLKQVLARKDTAADVLRRRFEHFLENAQKRSDFDLVVFRTTQFLKSMEEEFPTPSKAAESAESKQSRP